jgi:hypothetical protein
MLSKGMIADRQTLMHNQAIVLEVSRRFWTTGKGFKKRDGHPGNSWKSGRDCRKPEIGPDHRSVANLNSLSDSRWQARIRSRGCTIDLARNLDSAAQFVPESATAGYIHGISRDRRLGRPVSGSGSHEGFERFLDRWS